MKAIFGSGGATRLGGINEGFDISVNANRYDFDIIGGISASAILAPIVCLAKKDPSIFEEVRELAVKTNLMDLFPGFGNAPVTKKNKLSIAAIARLLFGKESVGIQNIRPVFEKVLPKSRFADFLATEPICLVMAVEPRTGKRVLFNLKDARTWDEMLDMIEASSRIMFWTQPQVIDGVKFVDGGMRNHTPSVKILREYPQITEVVSIFARPKVEELKPTDTWDENGISVLNRMIEIMAFQLSRSDEDMEQLLCGTKVPLLQIMLPHLNGLYNTDPNDIREYIYESRKIAVNRWYEFKNATK